MTRRIDLNCDLGEGCANDAAIMPWITSANIACGAHAGDAQSMRATLRLCRQWGVCAGAHPGYPDREHFGRRELDSSPVQIAATLHAQLQQLLDLAKEEGVHVAHVKPDGALYNQCARDPALAATVAATIHAFDPGLILVGLAGSELPRAGLRAGLRVAHEAFADRRYLSTGELASRSVAGAVIGGTTTGSFAGAAVGGAIGAVSGAVVGELLGRYKDDPDQCVYVNRRTGERYLDDCPEG